MTRRIVAEPRQPLRVRCVLAIAGSDSSGGAGLQADLRTFAALGVHGLSAITAVTAQNTAHVRRVHRIPAAALRAQLDAAREGFEIAAVKIGMLGSRAAVEEVAQFLRESRCPAVLDPVLLSSSGTPLLPRSALGALCESLIPLVQVLTPNLPEARSLLRLRGPAPPARELARQLSDLGAASVLLKGGHSDEDPVCDYYVAAGETRLFRHRRLPYEARGTGCTLASAVAAGLARGLDTAAAVSAAQRYLQRRWRAAYRADRSGVRLLGPLARG